MTENGNPPVGELEYMRGEVAGVCVCDEIVYIFNKAKCIHKLIQYIINEKDYETFCHHHSPITYNNLSFPFSIL